MDENVIVEIDETRLDVIINESPIEVIVQENNFEVIVEDKVIAIGESSGGGLNREQVEAISIAMAVVL